MLIKAGKKKQHFSPPVSCSLLKALYFPDYLQMADSDRYYDTGSAVNSRSSSFSSGPGGLRGSHSDTRLYERTKALRRNSSSSMSCVEASDSSSIHDSDKVHFLVKKFPWRTQWRSLDNVSSSCSSRRYFYLSYRFKAIQDLQELVISSDNIYSYVKTK